MSSIIILFALIISLTEAFAQYSLKSNKLFFGIIGYSIVAMILFTSYNYEDLGHMNLIWSCVSIIMCFFIGVFIFNEKFNKYTMVAVIFAISAIYFGHLSDDLENWSNDILKLNK